MLLIDFALVVILRVVDFIRTRYPRLHSRLVESRPFVASPMSVVDAAQLGTLTLEGSVSLLIFVLAVKLCKMRVHTQSGCCGDALLVTTDNPGSDTGPPLV